MSEFKQSRSSCGCATFAHSAPLRGYAFGLAGIKANQNGSNQIKPNQTKSNLHCEVQGSKLKNRSRNWAGRGRRRTGEGGPVKPSQTQSNRVKPRGDYDYDYD
jgi:hypothetical protein